MSFYRKHKLFLPSLRFVIGEFSPPHLGYWGRDIEMKIFFGFALADGMFRGDCTIERHALTLEQVTAKIEEGVVPCLNPSHETTIHAMRERFGLDVTIPSTPPRVELELGDSVIVMGVRGLPRMTDRHEYTHEEVAAATFVFSEYRVIG
jgi:hypothetical protein